MELVARAWDWLADRVSGLARHRWWIGVVALIVAVVFLEVGFEAQEPRAGGKHPASSLAACRQDVAALRSFVVAHTPTVTTASARGLEGNVKALCPPATTAKVVNTVIDPWLRSGTRTTTPGSPAGATQRTTAPRTTPATTTPAPLGFGGYSGG